MRPLLTLPILIATLWGCTQAPQPKDTNVPDAKSVEKRDSIFKAVANFPTIADTTKFIADLRTVFNLEVHESPVQKANQKITAYTKVKINGAANDYIFIEYDYGTGSGAAFPWKYQLVLTTGGKPVKALSGLRYEFVQVFKNENPYLLILDVTYKGNGGHRLYKIVGDTLHNVYEGYYNYEVQTYDDHADQWVFMPRELKLTFNDVNNDGFNDLIFSGQKLMLGKYTNDSLWYDVENGKPFTVENPAGKVPIKYTFLFDPKTGHYR